MTAAELSALGQLSARFDDFREDNIKGHEDIKNFIRDVEARLTAKICAKDTEIKAVTAHCKERQVEVDAMIARGVVEREAHIAAARLATVAEVTKPSVYSLATKGALDGLLRFALKAAVIVTLAGGLWTLLDKAGLF